MVFAAGLLHGCGDSTVTSPFRSDAGGDAAAADGDGGPGLDAPDSDPNIGGPCVDDGQCDDGVDCTFDRCDLDIGRCRFEPDDTRCADSIYCDGVERCDRLLGCREGEPVACSDGLTCTIDSCDEAGKSCQHGARDADGDTDPDGNCPGGGDCNEADPNVSSKHAEICGNKRDDNCDGSVDEQNCVAPEHDTCLDPLLISGSGNYALSLKGTKADYSASCAGAGSFARDAVAALVVPAGNPLDVDVTATAASGSIALAAAGQCGDVSSEIGCSGTASPPNGGVLSRLRLRALSPGNYPLYLFGSGDLDVALKVKFEPATSKSSNETCGTAAPIMPGVHTAVSVIDAASDLSGACQKNTGELVYSFDLGAVSDVNVSAVSLDGTGVPSIALLPPACQSELTCSTSANASLYARALPPGTYYLAVAATAPTDLDVLVTLSAPTPSLADDVCGGAPPLTVGQTVGVSLDGHVDDYYFGCLAAAKDAAYGLELSERSDVLLSARLSDGDSGAVTLSKQSCAGPSDALVCHNSGDTPVRARVHDVAPGSYRAVVETEKGAPTTITAFVRKAVAPTLVAFADSCAQAVIIPESGGFFQGNTANASADYDAACDFGGQPAGGAPDQMLSLTLSAKKRVVFDMQGSSYNTLLDVRRGPQCPGVELTQSCAAGYLSDKSFLDLILDPGQYFVQVDGYASSQGEWQLEVFVVDP